MYNLLIIEDDKDIADMIMSFLKHDFNFDLALDGEAGLKKLEDHTYDMMILDLMLPKMSGLDVLREIRQSSQIPVLILSAKDTDIDKAVGLGYGADDYLQKPFSMIELQARIKALIRRSKDYISSQREDDIISRGDLVLNASTYSVTKAGGLLKLTPTEFDILKLLMKNPDRVYTKAQLFEAVWNEAYYNDDNVINVHISRLREKVEKDPSKPTIVTTVWGVGYKLGDLS